MTRKFSELRANMSPEAQARAKARADEMLRAMALAELRRARDLTQQQIATNLKVNQAWISKFERQVDMYVSTLRTYVEALGGELEISARFPDCNVRLTQFKELASPQAELLAVELRPTAANAEATEAVHIWTQGAVAQGSVRTQIWPRQTSNTTGDSRTTTRRTPDAASEAA
jgi:transcriptional regulator with XRE-family HTH domain